MRPNRILPSTWLLAAGLAVAGCMNAPLGNDPPAPDPADYASYDEAKAAQGSVFEAHTSEGSEIDVRVKFLYPEDPQDAPQGQAPIVLLLFDAENDTAITDATVTLESHMPAMGHGTTDEEDPVHGGNGVYEGRMNLMMPGEWVLHITVERPDGGYYEFEIDAKVGG